MNFWMHRPCHTQKTVPYPLSCHLFTPSPTFLSHVRRWYDIDDQGRTFHYHFFFHFDQLWTDVLTVLSSLAKWAFLMRNGSFSKDKCLQLSLIVCSFSAWGLSVSSPAQVYRQVYNNSHEFFLMGWALYTTGKQLVTPIAFITLLQQWVHLARPDLLVSCKSLGS